MLARFRQLMKGIDLDSKLTLFGLLLAFMAWGIDYVRSPDIGFHLTIVVLIAMMISFFLLMLSESLRREKRIDELLGSQHKFLRTEFPQLVSMTVRAQGSVDDMGVVAIHNGRSDDHFLDLLSSSSREVCLMGISFYHYASLMRPVLPALLAEKQFDLRILIAKETAVFVREKEREEEIYNRITGEIDGVIGMLDVMKMEAERLGYTGRMEARQYTGLTYCSLYIFDDSRVVYNPYLRNTPGKILPVFEIMNKEGGVYPLYRKHFERVWNDETTVIATRRLTNSQ